MSEVSKDSPIAGKENFSVPQLKTITVTNYYDFELFSDFEDLVQVNKAILYAKQALFRVNSKLSIYEGKVSAAKTAFNRKWRREYLKSQVKTDTGRKINADLECEELEDEVIINEQIRDDFKKLSYILKTELQTLQTVSSNIRQQMSI